MGPIRGGGEFPPWAWHQGRGPLPPWPAQPPPPLGFSPTWGTGGGGTPSLAYIRRSPPFFQHTIISSLSLLLLPRADSPCLEFALGMEFSTIGRSSLCRSRDPNPSFF